MMLKANDMQQPRLFCFPTSGEGTATITGRTSYVYDWTNFLNNGSERRTAPQGTKIIASIATSQTELMKYISHTGDGRVLDVVYQGITATGEVGSDGRV